MRRSRGPRPKSTKRNKVWPQGRWAKNTFGHCCGRDVTPQQRLSQGPQLSPSHRARHTPCFLSHLLLVTYACRPTLAHPSNQNAAPNQPQLNSKGLPAALFSKYGKENESVACRNATCLYKLHCIGRIPNIPRNSKVESRNSKPEARNSKLETRNSKPESRRSKLDNLHSEKYLR